MPSTSNVSTTGNLDIDGILSGTKWTSPALTFSFPTLMSQYGYTETGFQAMNSTQMAAVRAILNAYASVSGLTFTETSGGTGTLRFAEENDAGTAYGYYPYNDSQGKGGDIWLNHNDYNNPLKGTYAWATFIHEIGHALGLDHGQDGIAALPYNHDSLEYSVMTYRSYVGANLNGYTVAEGSYPIGPMLDDIAAIQYMYGANYNTNSGNTTYSWSPTTGAMSINGANQGGSTTNTIFQTIWDGGGTDTYDFSAYTTNLTVDLSPGNWTTTSAAQLAVLGFGGQLARGNIANAYLYQGNTASLIENAIGGSGNDQIFGNQANNVLNGGNGNDTLFGGTGNDTLIGGLGTDTCILTVDYDDCSFNWDSILEIFTITSLLEGIDSLSGIEWVQFGDGTRSVASMIAPAAPDTTNPTLNSTTPGDNATSVSRSANLVLTFNEAVAAGAGDIVIHYANGDVAMTIAASDTSQVSISGNVVTINPSSDLGVLTDYYVTIDADALHDTSDNYFGGISASDTFNFTTASNIITGTSGANTLNGTEGDDTINGMGGTDKLYGFGGNDTLDGGLGSDTMTGGLGDDTYYVNTSTDKVIESAGQGTDSVFSSVTYTLATNVEVLTLTGSSAINGTGNASNNLITGNNAANSLSGAGGTDALFGMGGNDKLNGGAGDDGLSGGLGKDSLTGGTGKDYFYFDTALSAGNIDTITDFKPIDDTIALDSSIFTALADGPLDASAFGIGSSAANANVHIYYNKSTGGLFYDADGAGGAAGQQIATLSKNLTLTAADFLII